MKSINCLRCRHCSLARNTDFSSRIPTIYCGKKQEQSVLILSGCGLADPRPRLYKTTTRALRQRGDKVIIPTKVELTFVAFHYPTTPTAKLLQLTGRPENTVKSWARKYRWKKRNPQHSFDFAHEALKAKGIEVSDAQSAYILERYKNGTWPVQGGDNRESALQQRRILQNEIVRAVAELGPAHSWRKISRHLLYKSPAYKRYSAQRCRTKKRVE